MLIQNKSKYTVVTLGPRKADVIGHGENLAKTILPMTIHIKTGLCLSLVTKIEEKIDKLIIRDSLVENEVNLEFIE